VFEQDLATAFSKILEDFGISDKVNTFSKIKLMIITYEFVCMQVLSITCDNASPNDTMIDELSSMLEGFPGAANRT
jgi:hypothetical protein